MKLTGIFGKGTGRKGDAVFAVSGGEQIVRQYNPNVSNPNSAAQVAQRAKLKLMSQLAAALAPALGFTKKGLVSARNQFVSKNIAGCSFESEQAYTDLMDIQLTPSNVGFNGLNVTSSAGTISVALAAAAAADVKRVAYFVFEQTGDNQLSYVASKIVAEAGAGRTFPSTITVPDGAYIVYAYGIKDNSAAATMRYENYVAENTGSEATLDVIALFRSSDYGLTMSSGARIVV